MCSHKRWRIWLLILCLLCVPVMAWGDESGEGASPEPTPTPVPTAAILARGEMEANTNRQAHPFSTAAVESRFDLAGFELALQSDELAVYLNREYGTLRIVNRETGYVWGALPLTEAEGLNTSWNCYGNSIVALECFDEAGVSSRLSLGKDATASYEVEGDTLLCHADFETHGISLSAYVRLQGNRVQFGVVEDSLQEGLNDSGYLLKSLIFLPYLGASYNSTIDGYFLIPDGCGALIRFRDAANYASTYDARIYGSDYGIESTVSMTNSYMYDIPQIYLPVYGVVHGARQNGFLTVVEAGDAYASIVATPSLTNNPYNWAAVRFDYRQKYVKNINRKEGAGAVVPQAHINALTPALSVYVLSGDSAHYDGMAAFYRTLLTEEGVLAQNGAADTASPLHIEFLGAAKKEAFIGKGESVFTTAEQAANIVDRLYEQDVRNLSAVYRSFTVNDEAGGRLLRSLGDGEEFQALQALVSERGNLYFRVDPFSANEDQITLRTEAANNLSGMEIKRSSGDLVMYADTWYFRPSEVARRLAAAVGNATYGDAIALDGISFQLYGDFTSGHEMQRDAVLEQTLTLVEELDQGKIPMYQPNGYLWKYTSEMYDLPLTGGQLLYESDTVPFLQIVLSGSADLFSAPVNTRGCSTDRLLRMVEYGVYPSFVVTSAESTELYGTAQEPYYSTCFNDWGERIVSAYHFVASALDAVRGSRMIAHDCLKNGVIRVCYENGVQIYINYTDIPKQADGRTIEAGSYLVVEGK